MALRTHIGTHTRQVVSGAATLAAALLDFVYPPHCPACRAWQPPEDRDPLCRACVATLTARLGPRCARCGGPAATADWEDGCRHCRHWPAPPAYDGAAVLADFHGPAGAAVHALKFHGLRRIGPFLGGLLATQPDLAEILGDLDVLVPVPLHPARRRERGFNQAEDLAQGLGEALKVPVEPQVLRRGRPTRQQARLAVGERARNLLGAFEIGDPDPLRDAAAVGLVDDVLTTGATLSAAAAVLRGAGAPDLRVIAVAAASPFRAVAGPDSVDLTPDSG